MNVNIQNELDMVKESILQVVPAEAIYLFGSYADGTAGEGSDFDIYVIVPDDMENLSELYGKVLRSIRNKTLFPMDLLVGHSNMFNRRKNGPTIEKTIAEKGLVLYAS